MREAVSLPDGVACFAIAGSTSKKQMKRLPGDGLVPIDSALGRHKRPELTLEFPPENQFIALGTPHLDLLNRAEVYQQLRTWLST